MQQTNLFEIKCDDKLRIRAKKVVVVMLLAVLFELFEKVRIATENIGR